MPVPAYWSATGVLVGVLPSMSDQTLGRNVRDRVHAWANDGGWGWGPSSVRFDALKHLDLTVVNQVCDVEVGAAVREALAVES